MQHFIANAKKAFSVDDDIAITALDAVCWIDCAWRSGTETTLRNTFKEADFVVSLLKMTLHFIGKNPRKFCS